MRRSNPGGELSMNDARAIIERQKSQINSQHQMISQKEQELQRLRHINSQPGNVYSKKSLDLSIDEEVKLQQLRGLRGQTEKLRLNNEVILNEISTIKGHLSNRSTDLASHLRTYHQLDEQIKQAMSWREWLDECLKLIVTTCNNSATAQDRKRLCNLSQEAYSRPALQLLSQEQWKAWNDSIRRLKQTDDRIASKSNSFSTSSPQTISKPESYKSSTSSFNKPLPNLARNDKKIESSPGPYQSTTEDANHFSNIYKTSSKNEVQPTAVSGLFTRATNSPPSARRASLMLLLNSAASTPSVTPTGEPNKVFQVSGSKGMVSRQKCPEATIFALGRAKTPPRYASRTVINDTYMRRLLDKENIEKYKKTANEIYMNQVAKISTKYLENGQKPEDKKVSVQSMGDVMEKAKETEKHLEGDDKSQHSNASSSDSSLNMDGLPENDAIEVDLDKPPNAVLNSDKDIHNRPAFDQIKTDKNSATMTTSTNNSADSAVIADMSNSSSVNSQCPAVNNNNVNNTCSNMNGAYSSTQGGNTMTTMSNDHPMVLHDLKIQHSSDEQMPKIHMPISLDKGEETTDSPDFQPSINLNTLGINNLNNSTPSSDESVNIEIYVPPNDNDKVRSILKKMNLKKDLTEDERIIHQQRVLAGEEEPSKNVRFHPLALLLDAALEGDIELVKKASYQVDDVSLPNDEGITALHNAVCAGRIEIAKFLVLEAAADVNAGDTDGWTPLHCAASCANLKLARLLVENGAVLNARTLSDYETPLEKCDNGACEDGDCEDYLYMEHERLFSSKNHTVYAVFDRHRPGPTTLPTSNTSNTLCPHPDQAKASFDEVEKDSDEDPLPNELFLPDELEMNVNDELLVLDPNPPEDIDWMLVRNVFSGKEGLVPKNFISCYRVKRHILFEERKTDQKTNIPVFKPEISDLLIDSSVDEVNHQARDEFSSQSSTAQNTVQYPHSESPPLIPFSLRNTKPDSSPKVTKDPDPNKKSEPVVIQTAM